MYIELIGPMGSGKTTLAIELYNGLPADFDLVFNTNHQVFEWEAFKGKHADPQIQPLIQSAMTRDHFHLIFGTFLKDANRNVIMDSGFIEHLFYNKAKYRIGRYDSFTSHILEEQHNYFTPIVKKPDITIYVKTEPEQVIKNIQTRNRRGEKNRDMTEMLSYIRRLSEEYEKYQKIDIIHQWGTDAKVTLGIIKEMLEIDE